MSRGHSMKLHCPWQESHKLLDELDLSCIANSMQLFLDIGRLLILTDCSHVITLSSSVKRTPDHLMLLNKLLALSFLHNKMTLKMKVMHFLTTLQWMRFLQEGSTPQDTSRCHEALPLLSRGSAGTSLCLVVNLRVTAQNIDMHPLFT